MSHIRNLFSDHFKMVVLMNGHFACNVADRLLADMAAMPGKLMVHDVGLLGSWRLPGNADGLYLPEAARACPRQCACSRQGPRNSR